MAVGVLCSLYTFITKPISLMNIVSIGLTIKIKKTKLCLTMHIVHSFLASATTPYASLWGTCKKRHRTHWQWRVTTDISWHRTTLRLDWLDLTNSVIGQGHRRLTRKKSPRFAFLKISANAHLAHPAFPTHRAITAKSGKSQIFLPTRWYKGYYISKTWFALAV